MLVDAGTLQGYFGTIQTGVFMSNFLPGLVTGSLLGVIGALLALMIVSSVKGSEKTSQGQVPNRRVFLAAVMLLAICGICYRFDLEKSVLLALLLSVLLIAKLGGAKRGIAAAGIAAVMLAWFLPPNGSLTVTGLDNRLALALFFLGTVVGSIGRGRKSVAQPLDYNFGSGSMNITEEWCRRGESNPRPRDYETLALPLSYAGMKQSTMLRIRLRRCQGIVPGARTADSCLSQKRAAHQDSIALGGLRRAARLPALRTRPGLLLG